jgi:hypothetical protein
VPLHLAKIKNRAGGTPRRDAALEDVCSPGKPKKYKRGQPKTLVDINFFTARIIMSSGSQSAAPTGADTNHVSTAFVGQVSAARSPAIATLKGRARATNDAAAARGQPIARSRAGVAAWSRSFSTHSAVARPCPRGRECYFLDIDRIGRFAGLTPGYCFDVGCGLPRRCRSRIGNFSGG